MKLHELKTAVNLIERWRKCPSTHCERAQECRSPRECSSTGKGVWEYNNELGEKELVGWEKEKHPAGSNADEWHLFLSRYLDNRANFPTGLTYVAVQIAEALDLRFAQQPGTATVVLPSGYTTAEEFAKDCGFELAGCACLQPGGDPLGNCEICDPPKSLNQEAEEQPEFDNPRDPYASPDRLPS